MTTFFIYAVFAIIIIYDIWVFRTGRGTISEVFRKWYITRPIVPYMVGIVFIGHFQTLIDLTNIDAFIIINCVMCAYFLIMSQWYFRATRKFYDACSKYFFIPMALGALTGMLWGPKI